MRVHDAQAHCEKGPLARQEQPVVIVVGVVVVVVMGRVVSPW